MAYQRAALTYAETVEWKKRSLVGPRLQAALEGSARMAVEHMAPGWISHDQGAAQLLRYLKQQVRAPTLAEAGRTMAKFFYGIKRRRGEGMNAWIVRHDEALLEAERTLAEAIQEYGPGMQPAPPVWDSSWKAQGSKQGGSSRASAGSRASDREQDLRGTEAAASATASGKVTVEENLEEESPEWEIRSWNTEQWYGWQRSWWSSRPSQPWGWEYGSQPEGYWGAGTSHYGGSHASWDASTAASAQADRFLPDFVIAWLLLQRSGLDASERSVLVANLKNDFSVQKVKEALRLTWPDEKLTRRDWKARSHVY